MNKSTEYKTKYKPKAKIDEIAWSILRLQYLKAEPPIDLNKTRKACIKVTYDEHYLSQEDSDAIMNKELKKLKGYSKKDKEDIKHCVIFDSPISKKEKRK